MTTPPTEKGVTPLCESVGEAFQRNRVVGTVSAIIHWRDPIETGLIFAIGNFFFFLLTVGGYTIVSLISNLFLAFVLVCGLYVNGTLLKAQFSNKEPRNPFADRFKDAKLQITKEMVQEHVELVVLALNASIEKLREVFYCTNNAQTATFAAAFWALSILGRLFSGTALLYIGFLTLFVWPPVYEKKQQKIDQYWELVKKNVDKHAAKVLRLLPKSVKSKKE